jgi:ribonuclease HII
MNSPKYILGIDEAGRGALAGPVVVAGVVLDPNNPIEGLKDSKKLTPKRREILANKIFKTAKYVSVKYIDNAYIDQSNILEATKICASLVYWDLLNSRPNNKDIENADIKIDGNVNLLQYVIEDDALNIKPQCVVKGDSKIPEIMAASIIAKVTRDRLMVDYDKFYRGYDFAQSKGYPSPKHIEAIKKLGPCPIHRKTFKRVKEYVK